MDTLKSNDQKEEQKNYSYQEKGKKSSHSTFQD